MRARGAKPTRWPKKWAQAILVKLDQANNYPQHLCNLIISAFPSSFNRDESALATGRRKRTTKSNPAKSCCFSLNNARNTRFARLRLTASRSILPATISPNLE